MLDSFVRRTSCDVGTALEEQWYAVGKPINSDTFLRLLPFLAVVKELGVIIITMSEMVQVKSKPNSYLILI